MPKKIPPHGFDDQGRPIWALGTKHGRPVCGHKISEGKFCQSEVRLDNGRCKHAGRGGRPLKENATPETIKRRPGRLKLYKTLKLFERAEEARQDEELKSHRENVVLLEALIRSEGEEDMGPPRELWDQAQQLYESAVKEGNTASLIELGSVLAKGVESAARIDRLLELMDHQRRHREAEDKRELKLQTNLNAREVDLVVKSLLAAIHDEVKDPNVRLAIGLRFARLSGRRLN